jgi:hypothetical protein
MEYLFNWGEDPRLKSVISRKVRLIFSNGDIETNGTWIR